MLAKAEHFYAAEAMERASSQCCLIHYAAYCAATNTASLAACYKASLKASFAAELEGQAVHQPRGSVLRTSRMHFKVSFAELA